MDNNRAEVDRLLSLPPKERQSWLQAKAASGQTAVHLAIMHNRVWALRKLHAVGVDLTAPLFCSSAGSGGGRQRGCELLGGAPWFETGPPSSGIHVLYLATLYGCLDVLKYLTAGNASAVGTAMLIPRPSSPPMPWHRPRHNVGKNDRRALGVHAPHQPADGGSLLAAEVRTVVQ